MPVTGIEWITEEYDIHMIPGAIITPSLLKIISEKRILNSVDDD